MSTVSVSGSENPCPERNNSGLKGKMGEHRPIKWVITTVTLAVLLFSAFGCTKQTRYEVLTFFFTGVPPLEEQTEVQKTVENKKKAEVVPKQKVFTHTPYAARQCNQCHATRQLFGAASQRIIPTIQRTGARTPGMLVVPLKELCVACHKYLSVSKTSQQGIWLHGPAATARCTACHNPHQSKYRNMLSGEVDEVCKRCHAEGFILNTADHKKSTECLSCHNPHLGKDRNLLKKVYREVSQPVAPPSGAGGPQASSGNLEKGGTATRDVSEAGEAKSSSSVKPSRVVPSLSEVMKTQKKSSGKVKDQDKAEGAEVEAKSPSPVRSRSVIPSLQEVLNRQEKSAGEVKDQDKAAGAEVEAKSPSAVTPSRTIPSLQEVLNLQEKSAGEVSDQDESEAVQDREPNKMGQENYSGTDGFESQDPRQDSVVSRLELH
jgi:predicted CXXCH cytochrome family protein